MKIYFLSTFYPFRGGIAQFNALLYRAFEKKHTVRAITFKRQYPTLLFPGKTQYVTAEDIADKIQSERWLDTINPFTYISTALKIKKNEPSILITKYWMPFFAIPLGVVAKIIGKKTVKISILDNVKPHEGRFFDRFFNRFFINQNDGFIVMSDAVLKDLLSYNQKVKYLRINHPVYNHFPPKINQNDAQKKLGIDVTKKTLLFFGIIRDYKGLDLLIEAMNYLDDSYQLIIAGETYGSFDKYHEQIHSSKAKNRIHTFNKYIDDNEVTNYFSAAEVCILPYKSATQSGITAIANNYNLPIIATNVGGLTETIKDEVNGLIVDKPDAKLIASTIEKYYRLELHTSFSNQLAKEKEENSWENFADKIVEFSLTL